MRNWWTSCCWCCWREVACSTTSRHLMLRSKSEALLKCSHLLVRFWLFLKPSELPHCLLSTYAPNWNKTSQLTDLKYSSTFLSYIWQDIQHKFNMCKCALFICDCRVFSTHLQALCKLHPPLIVDQSREILELAGSPANIYSKEDFYTHVVRRSRALWL